MEKIVLFNSDAVDEIKKIASQLKIKVKAYGFCPKEAVLGDIADGKLDDKLDVATDGKLEESLLLMCDLSDKHVDKVLAKIREKGIKVDYKAVLTTSNRKWTIGKMFAQMEFEKRQYEKK